MKTTTTAKRLLEILEDENLKQVDILEKAAPFCKEYGIKLTKTDLSQYVSGKVEPGQAKLFILANALNVNEAWLMGYDVSKERGKILIKDHQGFDNWELSALSILAEKSGFIFEPFCAQYQIRTDEYVIKLSPTEVEDYIKSAINQIRFVTQTIISNKMRDNITSINQDLLLDAAHSRTDIDIEDGADITEDNIMDEKDF